MDLIRPPPCTPSRWPVSAPGHGPDPRPIRQRGSGLAGFLLAATPVLMLGLGGVELAHWMQLRQALSLALMDAARAGATQRGDPRAIATAFEYGLRMAYPRPDTVRRILHQRRQALGTPWHIGILLPTPAAFLDHVDPDLRAPRAYPGQGLIRNEGQARQHAARLAQGWPLGRGPRSGLTIHEANTLRLALQWPHRPWLPGLGRLIRNLAPLASDPETARLMATGHLPLLRQVTVAMHSHPADWPALPDGRVTYASSGAWPEAIDGPPGVSIPPLDLLPEPPPPAGDPGPGSFADPRGADPVDTAHAPDPSTGPGGDAAAPTAGPDDGPICEPAS